MRNALKDEKFRKLLAEYAEEISDPDNKMVCVCLCVGVCRRRGSRKASNDPNNKMGVVIFSLLVAV